MRFYCITRSKGIKEERKYALERQYSIYASNALKKAQEDAISCHQKYIGTEHILLGLLDQAEGLASRVLIQNGLSYQKFLDMVLEESQSLGDPGKIQYAREYSPKAEHILSTSEMEAFQFGCEEIGTEHILLAMLREQECIAVRLMAGLGINLKKVYLDTMTASGVSEADAQKEYQVITGQKKAKKQASMIESYCDDLTQRAKDGTMDPIVGRKEEMNRVIQILSRRTKNSPCLIGEPGVGKTAIVEGLAQWIIREEVPEMLIGKKVMTLDLAGLVAGSKYRGEFEERIKNLLQEVMSRGDILLFIDEIHTMIGAGGAEGAMDASNIVKPFLARGEIQIIGATTREEYRKYIEKDAAFERRFQPVDVEEPTEEECIEILEGLKAKFEEHHKVKYTKDAMEASVRLSKRYISDRFLPDKAIDVMDEAAARKRVGRHTMPESMKKLDADIKKYAKRKEEALMEGNLSKAKRNNTAQKKAEVAFLEEKAAWDAGREKKAIRVNENDIAQVVASWTKIPVARLNQKESEKLLKLEDTLKESVIGQDEAVKTLAQAIKRGRVGMKDPKRPIGSFMFLGPTGVGKTQLCKSLALALFGDEKAMIRIDMSEYMEKHSVSKLIGSPPGYVGYEDGGQLSEKVRRHPYSVLLFDEIEKAHPDVFNILLQVLDDGQITDSNGRRIDFKNTVIIMTSNAGAQRIMAPKNLGFATESTQEKTHERMKNNVLEEVKKIFRPEFLNRVDGILVFRTLEKEQLREIVSLQLKELKDRVKTMPGFELRTDEKVVDLILEKGYDPLYGARPIRRAIQDNIEDYLADEFLKGSIRQNGVVDLTVKDKKIAIKEK